jgi:hypothetical protein
MVSIFLGYNGTWVPLYLLEHSPICTKLRHCLWLYQKKKKLNTFTIREWRSLMLGGRRSPHRQPHKSAPDLSIIIGQKYCIYNPTAVLISHCTNQNGFVVDWIPRLPVHKSSIKLSNCCAVVTVVSVKIALARLRW